MKRQGMANEKQQIVKDLMRQGVSRRDAEIQAAKNLAQRDVLNPDKDGNLQPVPPGRVIFDLSGGASRSKRKTHTQKGGGR